MRPWFPKVPVVTWMVVFGVLLLVINLFPVKRYGSFEYWFAFIKVLTIFLFIVIGASLLFSGKVPRQYVNDGGFFPNGGGAALLVASFGLYSFLGIEMVAVSSGEASSGKAGSKATRLAFAPLAWLFVGGLAGLGVIHPGGPAGG